MAIACCGDCGRWSRGEVGVQFTRTTRGLSSSAGKKSAENIALEAGCGGESTEYGCIIAGSEAEPEPEGDCGSWWMFGTQLVR
jgi:hypothetical protein